MECWNCRHDCKRGYTIRRDERFRTLVVDCREGTKILAEEPVAAWEPIGPRHPRSRGRLPVAVASAA